MADTVCETFNREYSKDIQGNQTATRVFFVYLDSNENYLENVVSRAVTAGMPDLSDFYPITGSSLILTEHVPKEIDKQRNFYEVACTYESNTLNFGNPTSRPWDITFDSIKEQYVPDNTTYNTGAGGITFPANIRPVLANQPILNSAGFAFTDPPVTATRNLPRITLRKNFENITDIGSISDISELITYVGAINLTAVTIAGKGGATASFLIDDIKVVKKEEDGEEFYDTTFVIIHDYQYHCQKVLNAGFLAKGKAGVGIKMTGLRGADISSPWPLKANGDQLKEVTVAARKAASFYYAFGTNKPLEFSVLGLPTTF